MTERRCERTDMLVEQCAARVAVVERHEHFAQPAHCRPASVRDVFNVPPDWGPGFVANYDGRCSACGERTYAGERIRADGEGGYIGDCCAEGIP